ncbi:unnamed protein product [Arabidopsis halleri]
MADDDPALAAAREHAKDRLDQFEEQWIHNLHAYIVGENNIRRLQRTINRLELIMGSITNPAVYHAGVGDLIPEEEEAFLERKTEVRNTVTGFRAQTLPNIRTFIENETDLGRLDNAVRALIWINDLTNPADFWG